jgi:NosR/NirI family transcriptional regulator, nitrous oxide reductase regulator
MRQVALQGYRFAVVAVIAWLMRDLAIFQRTHGDSPIGVEEVKALLPGAAALRPDDSARDGLFVLDAAKRELGYVVRTQPQCAGILGYAGVTDALVVLDAAWKIRGITIHASEDTKDYVRNVELDRRFLRRWNELSWQEAADLDLARAGIEGVSGATMTSMAIARSVKARLQASAQELVAHPALRLGWRDWGIMAVLVAASVMAFGPATWRHRWKRPFQVVLIVYVGFIAGDLLAQKLWVGWARSGIPWTTAPGLVLLAAAALLVPWTTRMPIYCHHVCPHGAAQELIGRWRPRRWQWVPSAGVVRALETLPYALLVLVVLVGLLALPLDLAGIEPFAAYVVRSAGWATMAVAGAGLVASVFVPQAYCRFGCPTGALLSFVRARGARDHFSRRDVAALVLVVLAAALHWQYLPVLNWIKGTG